MQANLLQRQQVKHYGYSRIYRSLCACRRHKHEHLIPFPNHFCLGVKPQAVQ